MASTALALGNQIMPDSENAGALRVEKVTGLG
jgi:hypothetical protein